MELYKPRVNGCILRSIPTPKKRRLGYESPRASCTCLMSTGIKLGYDTTAGEITLVTLVHTKFHSHTAENVIISRAERQHLPPFRLPLEALLDLPRDLVRGVFRRGSPRWRGFLIALIVYLDTLSHQVRGNYCPYFTHTRLLFNGQDVRSWYSDRGAIDWFLLDE